MIKMMLCVSSEKTEELECDFPDEMIAGVSMAAGAIPVSAMDEKIEEEQKEEQKQDEKKEDKKKEDQKEDQKEDNKEDQKEDKKQEEEQNKEEGNREERVEGEEPKNTNVEQSDSIGLERPISPLNVRN